MIIVPVVDTVEDPMFEYQERTYHIVEDNDTTFVFQACRSRRGVTGNPKRNAFLRKKKITKGFDEASCL